MSKMIKINIAELQPGQLFINQRKLDEVSSWFIDKTAEIKVDVIQKDDRYVVIDGHTRLFRAWQLGINEVLAEIYNGDINSAEMKLYHECDKWCKSEGIFHISDLKIRIIEENAFKKRWILKCSEWMERHQ